MKITEARYKNVFAIRLETERYLSLVLPGEGGKIVSFFDKQRNRECLLQNGSEEYLHLGMTGDFEKCECSGFDDMFPTIDPVCVGGIDYPDHGEVCRVPFSYEIAENKLTLRYTSESVGYSYTKTLSEGDGGAIFIEYEIENARETPLSALWAGHCLVAMERGGRVVVPFSEGEEIDCVYDSEDVDFAPTRTVYKKDLFLTDWHGDAKAIKWYFPRCCGDGVVGYRYPSGETFTMRFDRKVLKYLGIWMDFGLVNGTYSVGLEPCTLGYDTVLNALEYGQSGDIEDTLHFYIELSVDGGESGCQYAL